MIQNTKEEFINSLSKNMYYNIQPYSIMSSKKNFYPKNLLDFFKNIEFIYNVVHCRGHRTLHSDIELKYICGRHSHSSGTNKTNIYTNNFFILWAGYYPNNNEIVNRKLQIQQNIPKSDKDVGNGIQHIITSDQLIQNFENELKHHTKIFDYNKYIYDTLLNYITQCK